MHPICPTPGPAMALDQLRDAVARLERHRAAPHAPPPLPFGLPDLDAALAGGGLARGALHEIAGTDADVQHGAAAAMFTAGIFARMEGNVLWVLEQHDLFAPGLAAAGLHPDRVIYAQAGRKDALLVMEDGLRHRGLAAVAAELSGRISLTASRRLQLAAEATGVTALLLRRPSKGEAELAGANAAVTRWRVAAQPSAPPIPEAPEVPGLGRAKWRLDLLRSRGGRTGSWIVEACDASGRLDMVAALADRPPAQGTRDRRESRRAAA
ncbi:MAG: damage-inducible mutagenesis protein [Acetobacteraceae bacterium]|nr:damage-inducible mutagenesis protein [Acetobacteraceae bacterium]